MLHDPKEAEALQNVFSPVFTATKQKHPIVASFSNRCRVGPSTCLVDGQQKSRRQTHVAGSVVTEAGQAPVAYVTSQRAD